MVSGETTRFTQIGNGTKRKDGIRGVLEGDYFGNDFSAGYRLVQRIATQCPVA